VDDDPLVLAILQDMLEDLGCDVSTGASADEALDRLSSNREIALLVADVNMPEMDGVELANRADPKRCEDCADLWAPGKHNGFAMLCKPFDQNALRRPLQQTVDCAEAAEPALVRMSRSSQWKPRSTTRPSSMGANWRACRKVVVMAINLDPFNVQEATFELPFANRDGTVVAEDQMRGQRFPWTVALQRVRLHLPFAI
jgi:two-component system, cell cycle response regulator CpdR